ncbi:ATP-binding protein [Candidatus Chlorohelix allophototropha]|uniref:histidine kinase n=1 Tax=Candidatus Chlorohelix allophototropha TaxID=3003348 RepID=A0ABY9B3S7_9CHLR|nr:ATP-binding protein [Chloroflexota bacterium L227-S17]
MKWIKAGLGRFGTLRWRLTLFYTFLVATLVVGLGWFIYFRLESFLYDGLQNRMQDYAVTQTFLPARGGGNSGGGKGNSQPLPTLSELLATKPMGEIHPLVLNNLGEVIQPANTLFTLDPVSALPDAAQLSRATGGGFFFTTTLTASNESAQAYLYPIADKNGIVYSQPGVPMGYVLLTASLKSAQDLLSETRFLLLVGLVGVAFLAVLAGNPLARLGLRPLKKITAIARHTRSTDFSQRVPLPSGVSTKVSSRDEVWQLATEFNAMLDKIEEAFTAQQLSEARMRQFVADASHELRSPLTIVGGYLEVLSMGAKNDPERAEHIIASMQMEIERLSHLVVDLLLLTRLEADGESVLKLVPVELEELLTRTLENTKMLAGERNLTLEVDPKTTPVWVRADADQLYRVLVNLIDNAVRYTEPQGHIRLALGLEKTATNEEWVTIRVSDDGCGIASEQLSHIFNRFYRADQSRTRQTGNAGLGLAISKGIIEGHGGKIKVESTIGKGASFIILLPLLGLESETDNEQPSLSTFLI